MRIYCCHAKVPALATAVAFALSACGGSSGGGAAVIAGATPPPIVAATAPPSTTSNAAQGIFAGVRATATGSLSSPIPLPTPAAGPYTLAGLAQELDASRAPQAGTPIGAIGIISAIGASAIVMRQVPMVPATDAQKNAIPFVHNLALIGSFDAPLTIAVGPTTVFNGVPGLAGLRIGMMIAAGGTASGATLAAQLIVPLGTPATATAAVPAAAPASLSQAQRRVKQSLGVDVTGSFSRTVATLSPAVKYDAPHVTLASVPTTCYDPSGTILRPGVASVEAIPQVILTLGQLDAKFPFAITYTASPSQFVRSSSGFSGPGPVPDWLNFVPVAGSDAAPTLDLAAGAVIGASLMLASTCRDFKIVVASATLGYAIESATTQPLPGPKQKVVLQPKTCVGINSPLNISLFAGAGGLPNFNPFGNFNATTLALCDTPILTGNFVTAGVGNVTGASLNNATASFDPSQAGAPSVLGFGTFFPTAPTISFNLTGLTYEPAYADGYRILLTLLGIPIFATPTVSPFQVVFAGLNAASVPVTIAAGGQLCATATSGNAFLGKSSACAGSGSVNFEICRSGSTPNTDCPAEASGTSGTVAISEPGYTGSFTVVDNDGSSTSPLSGGCESSLVTTYPVTVSPRSSSGPTAVFTINAGAQQLHNNDNGCNIYILDAAQRAVIISLTFIGEP